MARAGRGLGLIVSKADKRWGRGFWRGRWVGLANLGSSASPTMPGRGDRCLLGGDRPYSTTHGLASLHSLGQTFPSLALGTFKPGRDRMTLQAGATRGWKLLQPPPLPTPI